MLEILKKLTVEFIGTFFLVFTIGATGLLSGDKTLSAIAIGFALMVMVYAGGHISGGHYNPAVSLAVAVRKALPWKDLVPYWVAQILGGVIAGILVSHIAAVSETACPSGGMTLLAGGMLQNGQVAGFVGENIDKVGTRHNADDIFIFDNRYQALSCADNGCGKIFEHRFRRQ